MAISYHPLYYLVHLAVVSDLEGSTTSCTACEKPSGTPDRQTTD